MASAENINYGQDYVLLFQEEDEEAVMALHRELHSPEKKLNGCLYNDPDAARGCDTAAKRTTYLVNACGKCLVYVSEHLVHSISMEANLNSPTLLYETLNRISTGEQPGQRLVAYYPTTKEDLEQAGHSLENFRVFQTVERSRRDYDEQLHQTLGAKRPRGAPKKSETPKSTPNRPLPKGPIKRKLESSLPTPPDAQDGNKQEVVNVELQVIGESKKGKKDSLDYKVYAQVLADLIREKSIPSGTTIGLFGAWGTGKTFLLDLLCRNLKGTEADELTSNEADEPTSTEAWTTCKGRRFKRYLGCSFVLFVFIVFAVFGSFCAVDSHGNELNGTSSNSSSSACPAGKWHVIFAGAGVLLVASVILVVCIPRSRNLLSLVTLLFFKRPRSSPTDKEVKVIQIHFNAWEYAGSDFLWAGIVTTICNAVEREFGWKPRLFRFVEGNIEQAIQREFSKSDTDENVIAVDQRRVCFLPTYIAFLFISSLIVVSAGLFVFYPSGGIPGVKVSAIVLICVSSVAVFFQFVKSIKSIVSLLKSQEDIILNLQKRMTRSNFDEQLGFMHKVKLEVQFLKLFIRNMEWIYNKNIRLLIIIDDLDRVEKRKIHKILEAVNILLSDPPSPFISIIAIDSTMVVKAIEECYMGVDYNTTINGHEYLKKIIHLPICMATPNPDQVEKFIDDVKPPLPPKRANQGAALPGSNAGASEASNSKANVAGQFSAQKGDERTPLLSSINRDVTPPPSHKRSNQGAAPPGSNAGASDASNDKAYFAGRPAAHNDDEGTPLLPSINNKITPPPDHQRPNQGAATLGSNTGTSKPSNNKANDAGQNGDKSPSDRTPLLSNKNNDGAVQSTGCWRRLRQWLGNDNPPTSYEGVDPHTLKDGNGKKDNVDGVTHECAVTTALNILKKDTKYVFANPRSIIRIRNILTLTMRIHLMKQPTRPTRVTYSIRKLAWWVLVTEQWPYRISCLIHFCSQPGGSASLVDIYEKNIGKLAEPTDWKALANLDYDPELFVSFLKSEILTRADLKDFLPLTVNLDHNLRTRIVGTLTEKEILGRPKQQRKAKSSQQVPMHNGRESVSEVSAKDEADHLLPQEGTKEVGRSKDYEAKETQPSQSPDISSELTATSERLEKNITTSGMTRDGETPRDGNCFFHAMVAQCQRTKTHPDITQEELRERTVEYLEEHQAEYKQSVVAPDWDTYIFDMSQDKTWADHVAIIAAAKVLDAKVHIVNSSADAKELDAIENLINDEATGPTFLLGHYEENHYESLMPATSSNLMVV